MNMDMQALIGEMDQLIAKIKSGTATLGEIEAFAAAASQVNERAIVLRYKAYESKVFGTPAAPSAEKAPETPAEPVEEPVAETPEVAPEMETPEEEVSFDLFDESQAENEAFDLFSLDTAETIEEKPFAEAEPLAPLETPVEEAIADEPVSFPGETAVHHGAQVAEEESVPDHTAAPEPAAPVMEEKELIEESATASHEEPQTQAQAPAAEPVQASGDVHPIYKRLVTDDNSLAARLMAVRLETLKGVFGFNERLQIIRELFNGDADIFTHVIDQLDALQSKDEARSLVSGYAHRYGWDKDSDIALEFVQKVERRYA